MAKRGNGEGSICQFRGGWVARLILADGRRKAIYGKTRKEVAGALADAIRDRDAGLPAVNERITVGSFLVDWLKGSVQMKNRPSTIRSYTSHVYVHLIPGLGKKKLARLTPEDVEALLTKAMASGLTASTVNRIRATLRRALAIAVKRGMIKRNVAALADAPPEKTKRFQVLTLDQSREFLAAIRGHRMETLFVVAITTGLRQGEVLGLRWSDFNFDQGQVTVNRAAQRVDGVLTTVEPKTERSRRILTLPSLAISQLQLELKRQKQAHATDGMPWNPDGLVFHSRTGTPLDGRNVTRVLHSVLDEFGLPSIRFHDLRHTCASLLLAQKTHMRVIMEQLGHSQISLTMNTYSHVINEALKEVAVTLENVLSDRNPAPA